jgi:hypothetical protein
VGSDTTAFDGTVDGASFVPNGGVRDVVSGPNSGAYDFDGTDDEIEIGSVAHSAPFTFSAFIRPKEYDTRFNYIGSWEQGNRPFFGWALRVRTDNVSGSQLVFKTRDKNGNKRALKSSRPPLGKSTLITATYGKNGDISLFKNGTEVSTASALDGSLNQVTGNTYISGVAGFSGRHFNGVIDDARVYNRALSASEINQIYQNTKPQ